MNDSNNSSKVDGKLIAKQKKEKYRIKQKKKIENEQKSKKENEWFETYSGFITRIDHDDAKKLKKFCAQIETTDDNGSKRKRQRVESSTESLPVDDPRTCATRSSTNLDLDVNLQRKLEYIQPYMNLKETAENSERDQSSQMKRYFIAEGTETVRMLLEQSATNTHTDGHQSGIKIHSILTKPSPFLEEPVNLRKSLIQSHPNYFNDHPFTNEEEGKKDRSATELPFQIIVGSEKAMTELVGFPVARGAMACGLVPHHDEQWLNEHLQRKYENNKRSSIRTSIRILALENICDTANLGSLIRSAAAFGIDAVVLSDDSCDVWYRRTVRVSMGHVLSVPSIRVSNLSSTLNGLRSKYQIKSYAAVIDKSADMVLEQTGHGGISHDWCCVLGNEGNGLTKQLAAVCDHKIRIHMDGEIDSLSIGVAGGILLHGMREREEKS